MVDALEDDVVGIERLVMIGMDVVLTDVLVDDVGGLTLIEVAAARGREDAIFEDELAATDSRVEECDG